MKSKPGKDFMKTKFRTIDSKISVVPMLECAENIQAMHQDIRAFRKQLGIREDGKDYKDDNEDAKHRRGSVRKKWRQHERLYTM